VILDDPARRRLMLAARVVPSGLHQLISHVTRDRYLSHTADQTYRLTLPDQPAYRGGQLLVWPDRRAAETLGLAGPRREGITDR
jgi:hypothetical protein